MCAKLLFVPHPLITPVRQIEKVIAKAGDTPALPIGALTSDNRDLWTDSRAALLAASPDGVNAAALKDIESAMIVVCLDDTKPVTREDISWACWVGNGRNRFYDKHQCTEFCIDCSVGTKLLNSDCL